MVQIIYGLLAVVLAMLLSLNLMRMTTGTQQKMLINEVATQVTGISTDILERIGNEAFDEHTHEGKAVPQPPVFPLVTSPSELTPEAGFGGCTDFYDPDCDDIDDFDGMTLERDVEGIPYTAVVNVRYVDALNPNQATGIQTYAKEVTVDITSPYLLNGDEPLQVTVSRVFTYNRITS